MRWQRRRRRRLQLAHDELVAAEPISMTALILSSICSAGPAHELSQSGHLARACRTVKIQCSHESDRKVQHVFFRVAVLQLRHRTGAPEAMPCLCVTRCVLWIIRDLLDAQNRRRPVHYRGLLASASADINQDGPDNVFPARITLLYLRMN